MQLSTLDHDCAFVRHSFKTCSKEDYSTSRTALFGSGGAFPGSIRFPGVLIRFLIRVLTSCVGSTRIYQQTPSRHFNNNLSHNCPQIACGDLRKNRKLPRSIALSFAPIYVIPSVSTAPRHRLSLTATSARIFSQGPPMEKFQKIPLETSSSSFLPSFY